MKLKKLLALALAGVMAVSMLAGCKKGDSNKNDSTDEPVDTTIAAAMNEEQADNDVKVNFVYDSTVESAMAKYLDVNVANGDQSNGIAAYLVRVLDVDNVNSLNDLAGAKDDYDGEGKLTDTQTRVMVFDVTNRTNDGIIDELSRENVFAALENLNAEGENDNFKYAFTYEGKVATVSVENDNNRVKTYIAVIVSCTSTTSVA